MKKILQFFASLGKDKVLHFMLSMIVALLVTILLKWVQNDDILAVCGGWGVAFFVGLGKEIYDESEGGESDSADWLADMIGATVGTLIAAALVL